MSISGKSHFVGLSLMILLLCSCSPDASEKNKVAGKKVAESREITFAVLPYISPPHLFDVFSPLADYLSDQLQRPVLIKTSVDFEQFTRQTLLQRYDLVVSNPYIYLILHNKGGYEPLVADSNQFRSVFLVKKESAIRNVKDLRNKRIGMLPKSALAGHLLPMDFLHSKSMYKNKDFQLVIFETFNLILTALLDGKIDVGCFWSPQYEDFSKKTKQVTRVVIKTGQFVHDPYAVRGDLPEKTKQALKKALLALNNKADAKSMLKRVGVKSFIEITDVDYNQMREFAVRNKLEF